MRSTQNPQNDKNNRDVRKKNDWQIPERTQVIITPGAAKSLEDARARGVAPRITTDRKRPLPKKAEGAVPKTPAAHTTSNVPSTQSAPAKRPEGASAQNGGAANAKKADSAPLSLKDATLAEIKDRLKTLRLQIQVNSEDIWRGVICGALLILFALLQTTFFSRFTPFGKVPDLMLVFVMAIGVYEGEKWGSITGLCSAFIIQALGSSGTGPELLALLYMPAGCVCGLLSKYYLRHTLPVNALYVCAVCIIKEIFTVISALFTVNATLGEIVTRIAVPEYFSTLVTAPIPFVAVWLSFRAFHKTRAERTDSAS